MKMPNTKMWMIRAGQDSHVLKCFLNRGIAYLGWGNTGPVYPDTTREMLRIFVELANPTMSTSAVGNATGAIWRFCHEVAAGDRIVTYDPQRQAYHVGIVESDVEYTAFVRIDPATGDELEGSVYVRNVHWESTVSRNSLSAPSRNALNPPLTHCRVSEQARVEILQKRIFNPAPESASLREEFPWLFSKEYWWFLALAMLVGSAVFAGVIALFSGAFS